MSQNANDYRYVFTTSGFADMTRSMLNLVSKLKADGRPDQASLVYAAYVTYAGKIRTIAEQTALLARDSIRDHELQSRVRPDTRGGGGPRLGDFIGESTAALAVPGSVFINNMRYLKDNGVGWWATNEYGYSGHIGRTFIGAFDGTRPEKGRRQEHALLQMGKGVKNRGKGTIEEPIPERHFVRDGRDVAKAQWHARIGVARGEFLASVQRAVAAPRPPASRRRRRP